VCHFEGLDLRIIFIIFNKLFIFTLENMFVFYINMHYKKVNVQLLL